MSDEGPTPEGTAREQELLREIAALRARVAELEARGRPTAPPTLPPTSTIAPMEQEPRAPRSALSAEQFIGRRVVPFVGAIAVLGAIGSLVHYAIEIGLIGRIPPEGRFAIGVALGLGLLAAGELVRRRGAPGAAMGLDAAGVGAVMVSVALGVFSLRIFSPATGALVAGGAAVLAASWSLRSGSVAVAVSGIIGCFAMPAGVGLVRSEPRLAGLLVALALAIGLGVHLVGGARFALARWIAAARLRDGPIVCVTAEIDRIVPAESQEALWRALGEPPRYRFDGGHLELFLFARWNILPVVREVATKAGKGAARQPTGADGLLALDALPSRP